MTYCQSTSLSWNKAPISRTRADFCYCQTVAGLLLWGALPNERTGLQFTIAAGPRQCSHSRVRFPRDSWPYFTISDSRLPQPGGPGPCIYIPQEQGAPVIPPVTGFPFRRLLRLAGLRWTYFNPPAHRVAHLVRWAGLNILNKYPQNNRGPSSWGHCNIRDTLSPGDINMQGDWLGLITSLRPFGGCPKY
jgi:hypothetical protein